MYEFLKTLILACKKVDLKETRLAAATSHIFLAKNDNISAALTFEWSQNEKRKYMFFYYKNSNGVFINGKNKGGVNSYKFEDVFELIDQIEKDGFGEEFKFQIEEELLKDV